MRTSLSPSTFQAPGLQTTSRPRRPDEERTLAKGGRQRVEAECSEEALGVLHHLRRIHPVARELARQIVAAAARARRNQIVQAGPAGAFRIAEQMGGDRLARRDDRGAVLLAEPAADQAVQRLVERPHLAPESIERRGQRVRGQSVGRPPALAGVGMAELQRPGVRDLDQPFVARPHRGRQRPSLVPEIEQAIGVAQLCGAQRRRCPVEAVRPGAGAVRAGAIGALQARLQVGELALLRRMVRRDGQRRRLQPHELARRRLRQVQSVEARGGAGERRRRGRQRGGSFGGQRRSVAGDEVLPHPVGAGRPQAQRDQARLGGADEVLGVRRRRPEHRRRAGGEQGGKGARQCRRRRPGHRRTPAIRLEVMAVSAVSGRGRPPVRLRPATGRRGSRAARWCRRARIRSR